MPLEHCSVNWAGMSRGGAAGALALKADASAAPVVSSEIAITDITASRARMGGILIARLGIVLPFTCVGQLHSLANPPRQCWGLL